MLCAVVDTKDYKMKDVNYLIYYHCKAELINKMSIYDDIDKFVVRYAKINIESKVMSFVSQVHHNVKDFLIENNQNK